MTAFLESGRHPPEEERQRMRDGITGLWLGASVSVTMAITINCFSAELPVHPRGELFITPLRTLNAKSTLSV